VTSVRSDGMFAAQAGGPERGGGRTSDENGLAALQACCPCSAQVVDCALTRWRWTSISAVWRSHSARGVPREPCRPL